MDEVNKLVEALRDPSQEVYYHGDVRGDAAELLSGRQSIDAYQELCEELTSFYSQEDFLTEPKDLVFELLQKGVLKQDIIEGLKKLSKMLEEIEMMEFQAGETGRAALRNFNKPAN